MEIIRRNTDYAIRAMVNLANKWQGEPVSARQIADEEKFSYQLACKLLQNLHSAGLVKSEMGARGGYVLGKASSEISLGDIVELIQGPVRLNRCVVNGCCCDKPLCPIRGKLVALQGQLDAFLGNLTLADVVKTDTGNKKLETRKNKKN